MSRAECWFMRRCSHLSVLHASSGSIFAVRWNSIKGGSSASIVCTFASYTDMPYIHRPGDSTYVHM